MAFEPPGSKPEMTPRAPADDVAGVITAAADLAMRPLARPLPVIGRLPVSRQYVILGALLVALLVLFGITVVTDNRQSSYGTVYLSTSANMRMLTQRIAKATQSGLSGNFAAFSQLQVSRDEFVSGLKLLMLGGDAAGITVPASSDSVQPSLDVLSKDWEKTERNVTLVLAQQKNLSGLGAAAGSINSSKPLLRELAEKFLAARQKAKTSPADLAAAGQLVALTERLGNAANALLSAETVDADAANALTRESNAFRDLLASQQKSTGDADLRQILADLEKAYTDFLDAATAIAGNVQSLVNARKAARQVVEDSEALYTGTQKVVQAYEEELTGRAGNFIALAVFALLAAAVIWLMVRVYVTDERLRAEDSERQRQEIERQSREIDRQNRANQDAILRLMNEMADLADGDLRTRATVTEEITGAIADSVNFTVEELSKLVARINDAAAQLTDSTLSAKRTSEQLLAAADYQSREIRDSSASVLGMAQAMTRISGGAAQSAEVARQSLNAAGKGAQAVQNSIAGMNEIREQIQETSKRIKRLGESSQEIGEIVELISDITEQTNVLALNAAIQAASAGEAGRGFSVVAEEVQRLAERSAAATRQIGNIVKIIQSDTQDTVSAMEKSTQGVVEGAKLSDAAGQALNEIGDVSKKLAGLIADITAVTEEQSRAAGTVARSMQDILKITEQTTAGTQRTAQSIDQLSQLAASLKGSVSNFKI
jgi:twitching motility protein PilJ